MKEEATGWSAIVLAGSRPGGDPFAAANGVALKPLIPVDGEPMVRRPVRALLSLPSIRSVTVLTQSVDEIVAVLPGDPRLSVRESGSTIAASIQELLSAPDAQWPLLVTTADHALLDTAMIEDFCGRARHADLAIGVVEKEPLMARLPSTRRTWIHFRGGAYSGANLFAFGSPAAARAVALWRSVEQDRKKGWRMLFAFGPVLLFGAGLRLRTLHQSLGAIGRKLGISVRAVELANPLAAVDVDKPLDLILVEAILQGRA